MAINIFPSREVECQLVGGQVTRDVNRMSIKYYSIYNILTIIKKRPGMYVGEVSLRSIKVYLHGYEMAMMDAGVKDVSIPRFHDFNEFVREKYGYYESTAGWVNMILAVTIGLDPRNISWKTYGQAVTFEQHKKSVELFYQLLSEFCSKVA